jgi:Ca-activated chloride channel family protein
MLIGMRRLTWLAMGMLCITATAQQPLSPVSVGIVFDTSGSMGAKLGRSRQLATQFLKAAKPQDEFFLIEFNDRPKLASAFTVDTEKIQDYLVFVQSKGRSALWDAIYEALSEIKKGQNPRKALLVISDGGDNASRYTENEMKNLVRGAGVPIYVVGVYDAAALRERTAEEFSGPARLNEMAEQSGGRHLALDSLGDMPTVVDKVNAEVRSAAPTSVR